MREINQSVHYLVGDPEKVEELSKKDHARVLVCSDSHGHFSTLASIIKNYGNTCDAFGFCGDGAGDLVHVLKLAQSDEVFNQCLPPVVAFVRGNCDPVSYPISENQSLFIPNTQILTVNNRNLMFVHGHREGIDFSYEKYGLELQLNECNVGFYGHTHVAREENLDTIKIVNPGSCSRPRGGQPAGFAIATVEKNFVDIAYISILSSDDENPKFKLWKPIY